MLLAQEDSAKSKSLDSILLRQKGILRQLAQSILVDTTQEESKKVQRIDELYKRYNDRVIRHILIQTLPFGVSIGDTSKKINNLLTHLADDLHYKSRDYVIRNNLFFREHDRLSAYLLADNERHLRDLPFIHDARIIVMPVNGKRDSVDVIVLTKDILSLGGAIDIRGPKNTSVLLKEDNHLGWGDRLQLQALYERDRFTPFGYGGEYIKRNLAGSFIDLSIGHLSYNNALVSQRREETETFAQLVKPLVNPYMLWTYAAEYSVHQSQNMYVPDSLFKTDFDYRYTITDLWAGWNITADRIFTRLSNDRLRTLISGRFFNQQFTKTPDRYEHTYYFPYADLMAALGSVTIYRQVFYKTQYIYGFGRNEDVPEGSETTITAGWTRKNGQERPYVGIEWQRYFFNHRDHYFNYTLRLGSFLHQGKLQDASLLTNLEYFSPLNELGTKWKERLFVTASYTKQFNTLLDGPLYAEGTYGLPSFSNNYLPGERRITARIESEFFSSWSFVYFRIAPFAFTNATYFKQHNPDGTIENKFFPSVGGGFRVRNESLTFGTMEVRVHYFPDKNVMRNSWLYEFNTNLRFKYNKDFIKRPDFIQLN
jgi:hypothetical protein